MPSTTTTKTNAKPSHSDAASPSFEQIDETLAELAPQREAPKRPREIDPADRARLAGAWHARRAAVAERRAADAELRLVMVQLHHDARYGLQPGDAVRPSGEIVRADEA